MNEEQDQQRANGAAPDAGPVPLTGLRVVELGGIGPGPFCAMLLADAGADVIRVERPSDVAGRPDPVLHRGRRSAAIDLKHPEGVGAVLDLVADADVLLEGFRPGVAERLGVGPGPCLDRNPRLVYGRMTGFGQDGPLAPRAGHDINYIALSGALGAIGPAAGPPVLPLNLLGDFGGGGALLAFGVLCAVVQARATGKGQVVDAAMVDGSAQLLAMIYSRLHQGRWTDRRGVNYLDGTAPFYGVYRCRDGEYVAIGAIEAPFFATLLGRLGLAADADFTQQWDRSRWPVMRQRLAEVFAARTRDDWAAVFADADACVTPVLSLVEAPHHPHNAARGTFLTDGTGVLQPAPAPRFGSSTPRRHARPAPLPGEHTAQVLAETGRNPEQIKKLFDAEVVR
ncbi:CaiB/BaiF CoA transferase family protein [Streptomyces sporangiiformans]|uniref:CoA transferase n=1 Tax=Streptomyces sporangiiformans TaxID=2315329 RepID=A0A505CY03_9ACTN|nr:CaiB/BaiF CoA-transferase family protein [Streptomyces sporangiiformans]TPQ16903.1 CoA transferase [Streptomyces sporangiiformans]